MITNQNIKVYTLPLWHLPIIVPSPLSLRSFSLNLTILEELIVNSMFKSKLNVLEELTVNYNKVIQFKTKLVIWFTNLNFLCFNY
jgi:hypothetical protein